MDERSTQGDALRANLEALLEHVPILRNHAVDVALGPYRDLILQAHTQGHTYRAIAQAIRDAGFAVSPETVRRYVLRNGATPKRPRSRYEKLLRTRAT